MAHPTGPEEPQQVVGDVDFPATSGTGSGWFGLILVAISLFIVLTQTTGLTAVRGVLGLLLLAVLMYAYLMRPRVRIARDAMVLVNPLSTLTVPLARVSYVSVRSVTKVTVGEKTYAAVGVGRQVREMARPTAEGSVPMTNGLMGRLGGAARFSTSGRDADRGSTDVPDLLEDTATRAILQVRDAARPGQEPPPVRRTWELRVVVPALVLAVALVVALLL